MKNKFLKKVLLVLILNTSIMAQQGEFTKLDKDTMKEVVSGNFKVGAMVDSSYGFGATGQLGHLLDVKLGLEGAGAEFHLWSMAFKDKSAFLKKRPLEFYVSAGAGYRWSDNGEGDGFIVRTPIGADWQFSQDGWSAYLELGPSYNFGNDVRGNTNGFNIMSGTGIRYNF